MEPVFIQHGGGMDGTSWLEFGYDRPIPTVLADEGYVVYLGNTRGTEYSMKHEEYDPVEDAEQFWDTSYQDFKEDVLAELEAMYKDAGEQKGYYYGYSEGTIQMFAGLSQDESRYQ